MPLQNTTAIPLSDANSAEQQFQQLIQSEKILMVILGDSDAIQEGLILADKLARQITTNETLWVLYIGDHIALNNKLKPILETAGIIQDGTPYEDIKAFCLTKNPRKANTRIHLNGSLSPFRLTKLYREAIKNS
jgi:hypothetical protein